MSDDIETETGTSWGDVVVGWLVFALVTSAVLAFVIAMNVHASRKDDEQRNRSYFAGYCNGAGGQVEGDVCVRSGESGESGEYVVMYRWSDFSFDN